MKGVTKAMMSMNKQMKLPEIQKIMQEFEKQSEIMDMKEEMMSDVIDDALGDEDDEEETDNIVTQVLDELGLQMTDQITGLPIAGGSVAAPKDKAKTPGEAINYCWWTSTVQINPGILGHFKWTMQSGSYLRAGFSAGFSPLL